MVLGKVIGEIISVIKEESYKGRKILLVKPISLNEQNIDDCIVAVDSVGAGIGNKVLVTADGNSAMEILNSKRIIPLRSIITAIVDNINYD